MFNHHMKNGQIIAAILLAGVIVLIWLMINKPTPQQRIDTIPPSTLCMIEGDTRCNVPPTPTP